MKIPFPQNSLVFSNQDFSIPFVNSLFSKFQTEAKPFNGVMVVHDRLQELFLFILQGEPYAAAIQSKGLVRPVDLNNFFSTLISLEKPRLSLFSTDPVFFKSLLVFSHKRPSTKATTDLIDFERLLNELQEEKKEMILGLRQTEGINLFYIREGKLIEPYYLFPEKVSKEGSLVDQLLVYSFTAASEKPLEVLVFKDVQISPAIDMVPAAHFLQTGVMEYFLVPKPELIVSSDQGRVSSLRMDKGRFSIGRGSQNDLVLEDGGASREHALIVRSENTFVLEDLGSLNGTILNGKRVSRQPIGEGDQIKIGQHTILFLEKKAPVSGENRDSDSLEETTRFEVAPFSQEVDVQNSARPSLSLEIVEGQDVGKIYEMNKEKVLLGRLNSDVVLSDPSVSRKHAEIECREDQFLFHDLKSRNGSFINGERTDSKVLVENDAIKIGRTTLKVLIR